jgi:hypothetical protein
MKVIQIFINDKIVNIVNTIKVNFENVNLLVDSVSYFYTNNHLDSAIRIKEIFYERSDRYGLHGQGLVIDTFLLHFTYNEDLIIQKRGDYTGYFDDQSEDYVVDYTYDSLNRVIYFFLSGILI